jgi:hypothetical protein
MKAGLRGYRSMGRLKDVPLESWRVQFSFNRLRKFDPVSR